MRSSLETEPILLGTRLFVRIFQVLQKYRLRVGICLTARCWTSKSRTKKRASAARVVRNFLWRGGTRWVVPPIARTAAHHAAMRTTIRPNVRPPSTPATALTCRAVPRATINSGYANASPSAMDFRSSVNSLTALFREEPRSGRGTRTCCAPRGAACAEGWKVWRVTGSPPAADRIGYVPASQSGTGQIEIDPEQAAVVCSDERLHIVPEPLWLRAKERQAGKGSVEG